MTVKGRKFNEGDRVVLVEAIGTHPEIQIGTVGTILGKTCMPYRVLFEGHKDWIWAATSRLERVARPKVGDRVRLKDTVEDYRYAEPGTIGTIVYDDRGDVCPFKIEWDVAPEGYGSKRDWWCGTHKFEVIPPDFNHDDNRRPGFTLAEKHDADRKTAREYVEGTGRYKTQRMFEITIKIKELGL